MEVIYFVLFVLATAVFYISTRKLAYLKENNDTKIFFCLFTSFVTQIASYYLFAMFIVTIMK